MPRFVSSDGKKLIEKVLNTNPDKRYTAKKIKEHKWF